jgi:nucleoside-diphosphate-sugar epimerase
LKVAILGASSRIACDFLLGLKASPDFDVTLFARDPKRASSLTGWPAEKSYPYSAFNSERKFDAIVNFVGQSSPEIRAASQNPILKTNRTFDDLALAYLASNSSAKYVYISSGVALGSTFSEPATENTQYSLENLDEYSKAKQESELRHRYARDHNVIDLRIFSYFHRTQSQESKFLLADIVRSIRSGSVLEVDSSNIWRDFLGAADFSQLMFESLSTTLQNVAIDAFTAAPIAKFELLEACAEMFKLRYEVKSEISLTSPVKQKYYSLARSAGFDYRPTQTSLENVVTEIAAILIR